MTIADAAADLTSESPDRILELLGEQASLYARLETLAQRQRSLVAGDNVGPLLSLLADRQKLSQRLAQVAGALAPLRRGWTTYRKSLTASQRDQAERLLAESRERLCRIMESDDEDARILSGRKQAVAGALKATHATKQAIRAYHVPGATAGRLDCTDEGER